MRAHDAPAQLVPDRSARGPGARDHRGRLSSRRLRRWRRRSMCSAGRLPGAGLSRVRGAEAARRADWPGDPERVAGPKALAAEGDYLLENDLVRVVLDAPDHPHSIGPSGGAILDLAPLVASPLVPNPGDQTNAIYHAAGVLPRDAVHYESAAVIDPGVDPAVPGAYAAVIFHGHLESDPSVTVVTRYELRPCEPGVRVRTDLYNGAPIRTPSSSPMHSSGVTTAWRPSSRGRASGSWSRISISSTSIRPGAQWPFLAARSQAAPDTVYAAIACDRSQSAGFNSSSLTAAGVPLGVDAAGRRISLRAIHPGRAGAGPGARGGRGAARPDRRSRRSARRHVSGAASSRTARRVDPRSGNAASLLFYEPAAGPNVDDPARITPWNEVVPASDGTFQASPAAQPQLPRPALRLRSAGRPRRLVRRGGPPTFRSAT